MNDGEIRIYGQHEQKVIDQLRRCVKAEDGARGVLCADGHFGYSAPIGAVIAYREHVSPAAVGYDIGCGNLAVCTDVMVSDLWPDLSKVMDEIYEKVSFGMGRRDGRSADHPIIDRIREHGTPLQKEMIDLAAKQLGTVGAGNHYVDLFEDPAGCVWVGVHFGSRGFGHKTATHYLAVASAEAGRSVGEGLRARAQGEMEAPPDLLRLDSDAGQEYLRAMRLAGLYARAGRDEVVRQVRGILGARETKAVHNHHNFAWRETHDGEEFVVIRKGATPAWPNDHGFVGASMGEEAVILRGTPAAEEAMFSTVHGAGRAMSRTAAAGKSKRRWACNNRDCDWYAERGGDAPKECPKCGNGRFSKRRVRVREGAIDWAEVVEDMEAKGIELRGANAEEAPGAYKRLSEVLEWHAGTVQIETRLWPLGVAMASGDTQDLYKD